jgi:hypothetical protein
LILGKPSKHLEKGCWVFERDVGIKKCSPISPILAGGGGVFKVKISFDLSMST